MKARLATRASAARTVLAAVAVTAAVAALAVTSGTIGPPSAGALPNDASTPQYAAPPTPASMPLSFGASVSPSGTLPFDMGRTISMIPYSSCQVCHGDPGLLRLVNGKVVSYYVNPEDAAGTAHRGILCTGCHVDFVEKSPHPMSSWRTAAKAECKRCHKKEYEEYSKSAHAIEIRPGVQPVTAKKKNRPLPLCGDCHSGHGIEKLKGNPAAKADFHARAYAQCGKCHTKEWGDYSDYYHGAAYRSGAPDAPACWQCHGSHLVLPSKDPQSLTNKDRLPQTCGACHQDVTSGYTQYSAMIHGRPAALANNPVYRVIDGTFGGIVLTVRSWFGGP
jgi:hypothetical protein